MATPLTRLFDDPTQRAKIERLLDEHLDRSGGPRACWPWTRSLRNGRGTVTVGDKNVYVPRVVFALHHEYDPGDLDVLHECDNPPCGNPDHLFSGTHADNMTDRWRKGRYPHGELHAQSRLTEAQVLAIMADTRASRVVGAEYGVSHTAIQRIRRGEKWKRFRSGCLTP